MVIIPSGVDGISLEYLQDWSRLFGGLWPNLLWEQVELVRLSVGMGRIGPKCLQEQATVKNSFNVSNFWSN